MCTMFNIMGWIPITIKYYTFKYDSKSFKI